MACTPRTIPAAADAATGTHRAEFDRRYDSHLRHLRLEGLRPKTIEAYSRGMRRMGEYFGCRIDALGSDQLSRYCVFRPNTRTLLCVPGLLTRCPRTT